MIVAHLATNKHVTNLRALNSRSAADIDLMQGLAKYYQDNTDESGASVPNAVLLSRYKLMMNFMYYAGVEPAKIELLRPVLTRSNEPQINRSHLMSLVPKEDRGRRGRADHQGDREREGHLHLRRPDACRRCPGDDPALLHGRLHRGAAAGTVKGTAAGKATGLHLGQGGRGG